MIHNALTGKPLPGLRRRPERSRLALRRTTTARRSARCSSAAGRARPTTSAAAPSRRTSRSCERSAAFSTSCGRAATTQAQITFVKDRPGHDRRYAIDASKIRRELGWRAARKLRVGTRADRALVSRQRRLARRGDEQGISEMDFACSTPRWPREPAARGPARSESRPLPTRRRRHSRGPSKEAVA